MVQVNWTRLALDDLKGIYKYIARDSARYAKVQVIRLRNRVMILKRHPKAGKPVPEYEDTRFRELNEGSYRIIYKLVSDKQVDIITVYHAARDLKI